MGRQIAVGNSSTVQLKLTFLRLGLSGSSYVCTSAVCFFFGQNTFWARLSMLQSTLNSEYVPRTTFWLNCRHIPTGVLFDLLCAEPERPWNLTVLVQLFKTQLPTSGVSWGINGLCFLQRSNLLFLFNFQFESIVISLRLQMIQVHFRAYPFDLLSPCEGEDSVKWNFVNALKEVGHWCFVSKKNYICSSLYLKDFHPLTHQWDVQASYVMFGSTKSVMNLSQTEQSDLWKSVVKGATWWPFVLFTCLVFICRKFPPSIKVFYCNRGSPSNKALVPLLVQS